MQHRWAKKFKPREKTEDEVAYQRKIEKAREEAKKHASRMEQERKERQIEKEKLDKLNEELQEIEAKQNAIKQKEANANKYFEQKEKAWSHRLKLREQNLSKNKNAKDKGSETKMKKIQAFLKKTKQFEKYSKNIKALVKEMRKLKLGPYIDEVIKDLTNANISEKEEVDGLLELASAIHQRFEQKFTKPFKEGILDSFRPTNDLNDVNVRKRQLLNIVILIEMVWLGMSKGNVLVNLLKHIIKTQTKHKSKLKQNIEAMKEANRLESKSSSVSNVNDDEEIKDNNYKMEDIKNKNEIKEMIFEYDIVMIHSLEMITTFLKYTNEEIFDSISEKNKKHFDVLSKEYKAMNHKILNEKQKTQIIEIIKSYFHSMADKYRHLDLKMRKQKRTNSIILIERGSISDTRQEISDNLKHVVIEFKKYIKLFCDYLTFAEFPTEIEMENEDVSLKIDGKDISLEQASNASFFDDDVSRSFYESLPRLNHVPGSLLQGDVIKHFNKNTKELKENDGDTELNIDSVDTEQMPTYLIDNDDIVDEAAIERLEIETEQSNENERGNEEDAESKRKEINSMKRLLNALQCMGSRKDTEFLAEKYCYLNTKKNRKYLALALSQIKSNQSTRLPFYARFIAILNLCGINIGDRVCLGIEKEFYRLFFKNKSWLMPAKLDNLSYIAELTKFSIFPFDAVFGILQKLSKKFSNESIELLSHFMYSCGRYLYKNPLTHFRLNNILKYLKRRQVQTNLNSFLSQHISNSIYACKPPEESALEIENLTPLQQYIEHLIQFELNHKNKQTVLRRLRKLDWNNEETKQFVIDKLFSISAINFERIDCVAAVIQGLNCYHSISTYIVDSVLEEIRIGLEEEDFTQEQRRLSYIKFLGELYTYKAVSSQVVMDTLYLIVTFNIDDESKESAICNFRISLCCMLLEITGKYLRKGKLKSRCDRFLLYFQRFIILHSPIPFDIEWLVADVLVYVAPNMKKCSDLDDILRQIKELEQNNMAHKDALIVLDENDVLEEEEDEFEEEEAEIYEDEFEEDDESEDDLSDINSYRRKKKVTKSDQQFIDEYDKMMEQYRTAATKKTNMNNLKHSSVLADDLKKYEPSKMTSKPPNKFSDDDDDEQSTEFRLLSKKGASSSKLKVGIIKIPKTFIKSMRSRQKKETKSEKKMINITMSLLTQEEIEEDEDEGNDFNIGATTFVGDEQQRMSQSKSKYKVKQHSVAAKRKYNQSRKQMQHQKQEEEREQQKEKRDEKRKKHQMLGDVSQDF